MAELHDPRNAAEETNELHVDPLLLDHLDQLAPGLRGYTIEHNGALYVPLVVADNPGQGALSRYLDSLPTERTVKFPTVISHVLAQALKRRGFRLELEWAEEHQEHVEVWVREPTRR